MKLKMMLSLAALSLSILSSVARAELQSVDSIKIDSATFSKGGFFFDPTLVVKSGQDTIEIICRGYDNTVQIFSTQDEQKRVPLEISKDQCAKQLASAADASGKLLVIEAHKEITIK